MPAKFIFSALVLSLFTALSANATTLSVAVDNDGLFSTDREYTSGLFARISQVKPDTAYSYSLELGSQIWTPKGIDSARPLVEDRPYAGLLYLQARLNYQQPNFVLKNALMLGTVGPNSYAEDIQSYAHENIGSAMPNGWDYQIENKFVYQYAIEPHLLVYRAESNDSDIGVYSRMQLGNFQNEVAIGGVIRMGSELHTSFGSTSLTTNNTFDVDLLQASPQGYFLFAMMEARYRSKDLTIEGSTPIANNAKVKHSQQAFGIGGVYYRPQWGVASAFIWQSEQYVSKNARNHAFANLTLFYRF